MTAKEYLKQIEALDIKIRQKQDQLDCLKETAGGNAAIRYDKLNVQITVAPDMMERNVLRMVELEDELFAYKTRYNSIKKEAIGKINMLENENEKAILKMHYIDLYSFKRISVELGKDIRWMKRVHSRALKSFDMLYSLDRPLPHDVK